MSIGYVMESDYKVKDPPEQLRNSGKILPTQSPETSTVTVGEVIEISHENCLYARKISICVPLQFLS